MHSCWAWPSVSGHSPAGSWRNEALMRRARLAGSRYFTRMLPGASARNRCSSSGVRLSGRSRQSAAKIMRVRGRPNCRFSENITR
ncbi:hypothetical protein D3C81_2063240 [compost metagenome]